MKKNKERDDNILARACEIAFSRYKKEVLKGFKENEIDVKAPKIYEKMKNCKTFSEIYNNYTRTAFYNGEVTLGKMLNSFGIEINV